MSIKEILHPENSPMDPLEPTGVAKGFLGLGFTLEDAINWLKMAPVQAGILIFALLAVNFQMLFIRLGDIWTDSENYYQHGPLIPFASAYIIVHFWPKLKAIPYKPSFIPLALLVPVLYANTILDRHSPNMSALLFLIAVVLSIWAVLGWKWMVATLPASLYLFFGLPIGRDIVDQQTLKLQILSTKGSFLMLQALGMSPYSDGSTMIHLSNYSLDIAAACSGLKMAMATAACVVLIVIVGRLKLWANLVLIAFALPLALVTNSLRITLIGVFGNQMGPDAGKFMHDYGSYITMALGFFVLYKLAQKLGWKV